MKAHKTVDSILTKIGIGFFLIAITMPLVRGIVKEDNLRAKSENRALTQLPSWPSTVDELIAFPEAFNDYYADQFGYRDKLNGQYFRIKSLISSDSTVNQVTLGQDGWLFLGSPKPQHTGNGNPFADVRNTDVYSQEELGTAASRIAQRQTWLKNQGIEYVFTIAPNKHTIYFDKLPRHIEKQGHYSSTDQLLGHLQKYTDVNTVDLRPSLFSKKMEVEVYHKHDTHWNQIGANEAQFAIMSLVNKILPDSFTPFKVEDARFRHRMMANHGDLARMAHLEDGEDFVPVPRLFGFCEPIDRSSEQDKSHLRKVTTCDKGRLTALVFGDSFSAALAPFLSRQFETITYVRKNSNYELMLKEIDIIKPDIVIEEIVERKLPYIPDNTGFEFTETE